MRLKAILGVAALAAGCGSGGAGPHVVLISIDTLRADHVGLYGYARDTTPRLDGFFGQGTVFENATSPAPCTIPAVRQFLAGGFDHVEERSVLAELLRERGYATAAVVSQQRFHRGREVYQRGFEHFDIQAPEEVDVHGESARDAGEVTDRALAWLDRNAERPKLFLWLHYYDPHDPYEPPEGFRGFDAGNRSSKSGDPRSYQKAISPRGGMSLLRDTPRGLFSAEDVEHFANLYDGEIRYVDAEIGRLLDRLETLGLADRSIVTVLSDHGEWLGERERWYHCKTLRDEEIHVPFLMRVNGGPLMARARDASAASTLDLLPTLAGLLEIELPADDYHGVDLRRPPPQRIVASMWSDQLAVRDADWKLILSAGQPKLLYWTARDPGEHWNRIGDEAQRREALLQSARPYARLHDAIRAEKIEDALRAVGYIQ
jgi:arylsulfatase